uniref:Ubiquitin carboxyl-terminal hydrolase n=1 Tax=Poecilia latipinna TaxID=48699 RepID=A0A3B3TVT9_9TELE
MEWTAMEINPEVGKTIMSKLGVSGHWRFVDILGLEGEQLTAVPKPSCALMLLFPLTQQHEEFRIQQANKVTGGSDVYFLKQVASNSCGTIALVHAIANNKAKMTFENGSVLKTFLDETAGMSPDERSKHLEGNKINYCQHTFSLMQPEGEQVNFHFIAFVNVNGQLYEFDGKMNGPVNHGATKDETFVTDAAKVCRSFMEREKDEVRFSAVALCQS